MTNMEMPEKFSKFTIAIIAVSLAMISAFIVTLFLDSLKTSQIVEGKDALTFFPLVAMNLLIGGLAYFFAMSNNKPLEKRVYYCVAVFVGLLLLNLIVNYKV